MSALPEVGRVSDAELVARAKRGDASAEEAIYRRHLQTIAGVVLRLTRHRPDMEEVVQETFVIALEKLDSLRDGDALGGWLLQIAVRLVRRRLRRGALLRFFGFDAGTADSPLDALASDAFGPEECAELAVLDGVLGELPTEQRIAWLLRHAEGESVEEVAVACRCSVSTAKRRIAAAEARVQQHVRLKEIA